MYEIAQNKTAVMAYLKHAVELEGNIYAAGRIRENLRSRARSLAIPKEIRVEKKPNGMEIFCVRLFGFVPYAIVIFFIVVVICIIARGGAIFSLLIPIIFTVINIVEGFQSEYFPQKERYETYCRNVKEEEKRIETEKSVQNILLQEAEIIARKMQSSQKLLDSLYSLNVIYPKYRNLIAVSQFYEYFESGRRNTLTGVNGAYDLYEQERLQNMIIDRLDRISSQLGMLQRTQNVLYQEINRTNTLISGLESEIKNTNLTLQGIQNTAAITEYNSMVLARETGARDYINYYG